MSSPKGSHAEFLIEAGRIVVEVVAEEDHSAETLRSRTLPSRRPERRLETGTVLDNKKTSLHLDEVWLKVS